MDFLGPNDILVLEKDNGTVMRIVNGTLSSEPLLDVKVATEGEEGMLGIAVTNVKNNNNQNDQPQYVFLYYTEAKIKDGGEPIGNRLYRYQLVNDTLVNPKLILRSPNKPRAIS